MDKAFGICVMIWFGIIAPIQGTAQNGVDVGSFILYKNDNKIAMGMDQAVITDKYFELKIPEGLQNRRLIGSTVFTQILEFKNDEKIILLYIPNANTALNTKFSCLSYKQFKQLCEKEDIMDYLDEIDFKQRGYFAVNRVENGSFYAMYLNVRKRQTKAFEYSISSIVFPKP